MPRKIFIWVAHPRDHTLCAALGDAYSKGAKNEGAEIRRMDLAQMRFDPSFDGDWKARDLEPDLARWQDNVQWADHVLIVHPYWWGAMPTLAKAVLDIALTPGFGFKYHRRGVKWDKLLTGRTGDAIITSDTPALLDTLLYRKPARRVIANQVLGFVGIKPKHVVQFGSVKLAAPAKIARWITRAERLGAQAAGA